MTQNTKQAVVIDAMNYSRFGALSQMFVVDLFLKAGASKVAKEDNIIFARRVMADRPELVAELEAHTIYVVGEGLKAMEAAFRETGADRWCNPAAWYAVAEELAAKMAQAI